MTIGGINIRRMDSSDLENPSSDLESESSELDDDLQNEETQHQILGLLRQQSLNDASQFINVQAQKLQDQFKNEIKGLVQQFEDQKKATADQITEIHGRQQITIDKEIGEAHRLTIGEAE